MVYEMDTQFNYYDMNARGDIKLTALLKYINLAAGANSEELGAGFDVTEPLGLAFVIQRFALHVLKWPVYLQSTKVRTWPAEITKGTFRRNGEMWDQNGEKMAEWTGLWVLIDIHERKVRRPKALPTPFPSAGLLDVLIEAPKIEVPEESVPVTSYPHTVRYCDADLNMHMNNAVYGDLIANVLEVGGNDLSHLSYVPSWREVRFNYLSEARIGEEIAVECRKLAKSASKCCGDTLYFTGNAEDRLVFSASVEVEVESETRSV